MEAGKGGRLSLATTGDARVLPSASMSGRVTEGSVDVQSITIRWASGMGIMRYSCGFVDRFPTHHGELACDEEDMGSMGSANMKKE